MNDFTKDELRLLRKSLNSSMQYFGHSEDRLLLLNRLNTLIDNYCEHTDSDMDCNGGISLVCRECGATTMDI